MKTSIPFRLVRAAGSSAGAGQARHGRPGAARAALTALALAGALSLAGCVGGEEAEAGDTSAVTADLLGSRGAQADPAPVPGGGAAGAPGADGGAPAPGATTGPGTREVDFETLGFDSGDPEAPVQIVEFSDFGCGYCRKFHLETWPTLQEQYVETGKVRWKYVPMVLGIFGPNAEIAALAGECAMEQGRFPAVRDRLFQDQGEWKRASDARAVLRDLVSEEGVEVGPWDQCMDEGRRSERVEQGTALSRQVGVRGTPTFFIVGYGSIPGAVELNLFREVLDAAYADQTQRGGSDR